MMTRRSLAIPSLLAFATSVAGFACSSESSPAPASPAATEAPTHQPELPAPAETETTPTPEPTLPPPTVTFPTVMSYGGDTIAKPKVIPIVFHDDPLADQIDAFTKTLETSKYWADDGAEYGVGAVAAGDLVTLAEDPPSTISSTGIETWLKSKLSGATPALGQPDPSTLYAVYYPASTVITMDGAGSFGQSCQGYGGYHSEITVGGVTVGYAVLPRCADLDNLTVAASHEYFEWATDPYPMTSPAYQRLDDQHWAWQAAMLGELGDLCTFLDQDYIKPDGFTVQRFWSNKLSLGGGFPCAPVKDTPYVQAIPLADDDVLVPDYVTNKNITTKAIRVKPGTTKKVDMYIYSDRPTSGQIGLRVLSYSEFYGLEPTGFEFSIVKSWASVGDRVSLTIKAPKDINYDVAVPFAYVNDTEVHMWPVLVTNDDASNFSAGVPSVPPDRMPGKTGVGRAGRRAHAQLSRAELEAREAKIRAAMRSAAK